jgi:hypothetical protein
MRSLHFQQGFIFTIAFPWVAPLLTSAVGFFVRKSVVSFLVITSLYVLIEFLTPVVLRLAGSYFSTSVPQIVNAIPADMYWFISAFKIDYGIKVIVSAYATRFLIRRIPFVG